MSQSRWSNLDAPPTHPNVRHASVTSDVEAFIANGGEIKRYVPGATSLTTPKGAATNGGYKRRGPKRGRFCPSNPEHVTDVYGKYKCRRCLMTVTAGKPHPEPCPLCNPDRWSTKGETPCSECA